MITKIIFCKIEIKITEIKNIIFYNRSTTMTIIFLEICTVILTMVIIIIVNWIQDSIKTSTEDSFKIEINDMKIDIYKKITTLKKIQGTVKPHLSGRFWNVNTWFIGIWRGPPLPPTASWWVAMTLVVTPLHVTMYKEWWLEAKQNVPINEFARSR